MTISLDDLTKIFKHQTEASKDYTPTDTLAYIVFDGRNQNALTVQKDKLGDLTTSLEGYIHEGYRDRTPIFIRPESDV
jgi:hypothetical protein